MGRDMQEVSHADIQGDSPAKALRLLACLVYLENRQASVWPQVS